MLSILQINRNTPNFPNIVIIAQNQIDNFTQSISDLTTKKNLRIKLNDDLGGVDWANKLVVYYYDYF